MVLMYPVLRTNVDVVLLDVTVRVIVTECDILLILEISMIKKKKEKNKKSIKKNTHKTIIKNLNNKSKIKIKINQLNIK